MTHTTTHTMTRTLGRTSSTQRTRRLLLTLAAAVLVSLPAGLTVPSQADEPDGSPCAVSADAAERRAAAHGDVCRL